MQTTKWGPSGWKKFHGIAKQYPINIQKLNTPNATRNATRLFYYHLAKILPCKYCRQSYSKYINLKPIDSHLESRSKLKRWTYDVHNLVNDKLRNQGYLHSPNPSYEDVLKMWQGQKHLTCIDNFGWTFLHCTVYNYPEKPTTSDQINFSLFFKLLGNVIPCKLERDIYIDVISNKYPIDEYLICRQSLAHWLYLVHCYLVEKMLHTDKVDHPSFLNICEKFEGYRAGCGKPSTHLGPSCRIPLTMEKYRENVEKYKSPAIWNSN